MLSIFAISLLGGYFTARFLVLVDIDALAALLQCPCCVLEAVGLGVVCLQRIYSYRNTGVSHIPYSFCYSIATLQTEGAGRGTCCVLEGVHLFDRNDVVPSKRVLLLQVLVNPIMPSSAC